MEEGKRPQGAPTKYRDEYAEQAKKLCRLGATDKELADFFDVTETTINNWKIDHDGFFESLKEGKLLSDAEVADKLYKRATGYSHNDTHVSNSNGEVVLTDIEKHYPPDVTAAIFWLKNRQSAKWKDRKHVSSQDDEKEHSKVKGLSIKWHGE